MRASEGHALESVLGHFPPKFAQEIREMRPGDDVALREIVDEQNFFRVPKDGSYDLTDRGHGLGSWRIAASVVLNALLSLVGSDGLKFPPWSQS